MTTTPLISFGGIASGLPPDIVEQLMEVERLPLQRLEQQRAELDTVRDAWGGVQTRLSAVRHAVDAVRRPEAFAEQFTASSSNEAAVGVTVTGDPDEGNLTFSVEQLARAMQQTSADRFSGTDADIDGRTVTIDGPGGEQTFGEADMTLGELLDAINAEGLGVRASALQVEAGEYQLVLQAEETGTDNAFSVESGGWDTDLAVSQTAQDARIDVGGITVQRSGNTIDDLVDGLSFDLREAGTGPVTVTSARDVDGAVEQVSELVGQINEALGYIAEATSYDADTQQAGPLQGDSTLRQIATELRSALSAPVDGLEGEYSMAAYVGINLTRDGMLEIDEDHLRASFEEDFEATARLMTRGGESTDETVARVTSTSRATEPGEYSVEITKQAQVASLTGAIEIPPAGDPQKYRVTNGGQSVVVSLSQDMSVSQAVNEIRATLEEAGVDTIAVDTVTDGDENEQVRIQELRHGSAYSLSVEREDDPDVWVEEGHSAGVDAEVTFEGESYVANGQRLHITDGAAEGMRIAAAGPAGSAVTLNVTDGIGGALDRVLARAEGSSGSVGRAQNAIESRDRQFGNRIEAFERRLSVRESALRRQFTAMESALARLQDQGQWLEGQLAGMNGQQGG